jgi:hypothetical protein
MFLHRFADREIRRDLPQLFDNALGLDLIAKLCVCRCQKHVTGPKLRGPHGADPELCCGLIVLLEK